jgi:hypothetical protein
MDDDLILKAKWISLKEALWLVERRLGNNAKDEICDMANECKLTVRGMSDSLHDQLRYARVGTKHGLELVAKWVDWENSSSDRDDGMIAITRDLEVLNDNAFRSLLSRDPDQKQTNEGRSEEGAMRSQEKPLATHEMVRTVIQATYDAAAANGQKPPNIKELPAAVLPRLEEMGFRATGLSIQTIGEAQEFKRRRRKPGKTISSERREQQK